MRDLLVIEFLAMRLVLFYRDCPVVSLGYSSHVEAKRLSTPHTRSFFALISTVRFDFRQFVSRSSEKILVKHDNFCSINLPFDFFQKKIFFFDENPLLTNVCQRRTFLTHKINVPMDTGRALAGHLLEKIINEE